jgi:hypothetical protein
VVPERRNSASIQLGEDLIVPGAKKPANRTLHCRFEQLGALVEDSLVLTAREVVGKRPKQGSVHKILLNWPKAGIFQFQGAIVGEVDLRNQTEASVRLRYEVDGVAVDHCVRLALTEQPRRWWFVCPLENIRVAKLYLPPCARRFASRKAHGLMYKCQLEPSRPIHLSPSEVRLLRGLGRFKAHA